ncbi:MAG: transporter associated domain-containing protein [Coprococcus sp.]
MKTIPQIIGGAYLMKGLTPLEDITRTLGITFDDDFETLNGLLISKLEHIPQNNEFAGVDGDGYTFKVNRVLQGITPSALVKVTKITG